MPEKADYPKDSVRFLIVDDHEILRLGFKVFTRLELNWIVCGETGDAAEAIHLARELRPDFSVIDIRLNRGGGLELTKSLRVEFPALGILVYSGGDEMIFAPRAIQAGAQGFVSKSEPAATLRTAIHRVLDGGIHLSERMTTWTLSGAMRNGRPQKSPLALLSDRELQIFEMLGSGKTIKDIAAELHLSPKTVEYHCQHARDKLNLPNGGALLRHATAWMLEHG